MRVAIIINHYDAARGGVERYAETVLRALIEAGHTVSIIASEARDLPPGAALHSVRAATFWSPVKTFSFARGAARVIERDRGAWDAVLGLARTPHQDVYREGAGAYDTLLRATSAGTGAGRGSLSRLNPRHAAQLAMEKRIFSAWRTGATRRYLFNSNRVRDEILARYDVPPDRIDVLHNPVDAARFDPARHRGRRDEVRASLGIPDEAYTLIFSGSGFRRKGLDLAVTAAARARSRPWLLVAGKGGPGPYRALAEREGAGDRVIFAGARPDIEALYAASDALLAPTRYDAFSNATAEALAMGLPAITTRMNGASEVITEGREGFVVEKSDDTAALAAAVDRLAERGLREQMGRQARARAELLSPRAHADGLVKVFEAALAMGGR
ncbi:MAG: glycosyltransferase family 4 protein [Deltaproteobacteria bacterium]|nr:glycosyltransferase family 4 protein [Deltaproteobacteria bacterium]